MNDMFADYMSCLKFQLKRKENYREKHEEKAYFLC